MSQFSPFLSFFLSFLSRCVFFYLANRFSFDFSFFCSRGGWTFSVCVVWSLVRLTIANLTQVGQNESKKRFVGGRGLWWWWWGSFPRECLFSCFQFGRPEGPYCQSSHSWNLLSDRSSTWRRISLGCVCCGVHVAIGRSFFSKSHFVLCMLWLKKVSVYPIAERCVVLLLQWSRRTVWFGHPSPPRIICTCEVFWEKEVRDGAFHKQRT